jgi:glyoxylase-like metal-dependent hydrolase (beta-lactamase superfamily II)
MWRYILLFLSFSAYAQDAPPFVLKDLSHGVYAAIDGPEHKAGSNAGFVIGDDSVLVVDSFFTTDAAKALVAEIRKLTPKPIRYVVNTHYHIDHTGGDAVLREAGAVIIAHRNVRKWVHDENVHLFGDRITDARRAQIAQLVLPDIGIDKDMTVWLGSRPVEIRMVEGHTGGDLLVSVPDAKVLFCGDMLWNHVSPNIIDGNVAKWIASTSAFPATPHSDFVPGHGDVATAKDVEAFTLYLTALQAITAEQRKAGLQDDALVEATMAKFKPLFGHWGSFDVVAPREIRFMDAELAGTKRVPQ